MKIKHLFFGFLFFLLSIPFQNIFAEVSGAPISGAVDDIEKANQSQVFWYDNTWWGVFKDSNNKWAVWKFDNGNWSIDTETGIVGVSKADAHVNETTGKLYIMVSKGPEAFTRLTYNSGTWQEDSGFPIAINLDNILGDDPASLAQALDGDLFIFYETNDSLKALYSNDDGVNWDSYVIKTSMDVSTLTDGISFTYNGQGQMGLFVGQGSTNKKFYFFRLPDNADPSDSANWVNEALPYNPKSDDHVNILRDADNNLYMIGKNGKSGPVFYLYKRNNDATWEYYTFEGINSTRPALSLNEDNDTLYVCATNDSKIEYVGLNKDALRNVEEGDWIPIIQNGSDTFNNVTTTSQILDNLSDILLAAENETQINLWYNQIHHNDISLSVTFSSFKAEINEDGIRLIWRTESEIQSAYFILERSVDGINFNIIGKIPSSGSSSHPNVYSFLDKNILADQIYFYRISERGINGKISLYKTIEVQFPDIPVTYKLYQNYPNPFNPLTHIKYQVKNRTHVQIDVLNLKGQIIKNLVNHIQNKGIYEINFDGSQLSSGVYFCRLKCGDFISVKKMMLVR